MSDKRIDLQRRFRPAADEDRPFEGLFDNSAGRDPSWASLLKKRRVVILAEAGSGKSAEFERSCEVLKGSGAFAFKATVRDVAMSGLPAAFTPATRRHFADWKADPNALCWLFIDSVDEAKDQGHYFETAVRHLADAIVGYEERVVPARAGDKDASAPPPSRRQ